MAFLTDATIGNMGMGTEWVGMVAPFGTSSIPTDWLRGDGAAVSRSTYADLFGVISTTWGSGDGNTTFNVPNFQGEFLRGFDDGKGTDSGRNLASQQGDTTVGGLMYHWRGNPHTGNVYFGDAWGCQQMRHSGYPDAYGWAGPTRVTTQSLYHINCGVGYGHERLTLCSGASETRARNYAVHYCIKY